ncbi:MAG: hypothetical protein ABH845_01525 [Candidatus Omnitrophota bacterium]
MDKGKVKASVLIVTLWVLAILLLLAVGLAYRVGLDLHMTRYARDQMKAYYAAKAALAQAMVLLEEDSASTAVDTFQEAWSEAESLFKAGEVGDGVFSVYYTVTDEAGNESKRYGMQDEESRLPLNRVSAEVLQRVPGLEEDQAVAIRAWRGDKNFSPEQLVIEDHYYETLVTPYSRKGKPFETLEELLLVRGITPAHYEEFRQFFTVYGSGKVNLNTVSAEALVLMGLDPVLAQQISEARKGEDGVLGSPDDFIFNSVPDLVSQKFGKLLRLDQDQQLALVNFMSAYQEMLDVRSSAFRIQVEGRLKQNHIKKRILVVADRSEVPSRIRYWHEN